MQGVFFIHHMKRSGGHAVINWLVDNTPGAVFVNNDIPLQPILQGRTPEPGAPPAYADWLKARQQPGRVSGSIAEASALIVSLEDHELRVSPFRDPGARRLVIIRHPRNLFASRIRKSADTKLLAYRLDDPAIRARTIRIWEEHARSALSGEHGGEPLSVIFYDAWLTSAAYRARLARELAFADPRPPSGRMTEEGRGSSFGEKELRPDELLRRDDFLADSERAILDELFAAPEIARLAEQIAAEIGRLGAMKMGK